MMRNNQYHEKFIKKMPFHKGLFVLFFAALALLGGTIAYLTYHLRIVNQFQVGSNEISIEEEFEPPQKQGIGENVFKKKVQIENQGDTACFIRVFMEFSDTSIKNLAKMSPDGDSWYTASEYMSSDFTDLPEGWVYLSETDDETLGGYYYYTSPVLPNEMTSPLVERIMVTYEESTQIKDFDIIVTSESVQTFVNQDNGDGNFTAVDVSDDADGWETAWIEYLERR